MLLADKRSDDSFDEHERWADAQIISMRAVAAALTNKLGYGAERNIGHREWAGSSQGKWDPGNIDMDWFRATSQVVATATPPTGPQLAQPPNPRTDRVLLEEIWAQLRGPECSGWPQLGGKTIVDYLAQIGAFATELRDDLDDLPGERRSKAAA
jgi:hypothetical protein